MQPVIIGVRFLQCGDYSMGFYGFEGLILLNIFIHKLSG